MPSLRDATTRQEIIARLQTVTPTTKATWGQFDAPRMICHLIDSLALSLGELPSKSVNKKAFQHFPLKHLVIYVLPFPKSYPAAPEMLTTLPQDFDTDRKRLLELVQRLAAAPRAKGPAHPLFGPLTNDEWNALQWKHIAHHLKQFGC